MVENMEVTIISREAIIPSHNPSQPQHRKPYKLCLFDQLTPVTYPSLILFYPVNNSNHPNLFNNLHQTLAKLKKSLSDTLNVYYPFSGRTKNNLYIDDFAAGVPYLEARVNCRMSEYLKLRDTESLNKLVAIDPFCKEKETWSFPQFTIQVNLFTCGGIAVGFSLCHKKADGATFSNLLKSWAALFTDSPQKFINPDLSGASLAFPPRNLPQNYLDLMDEMWFKESNFVTRRFMFNATAIAALRAKARSEHVPKPSRNEALTGLIWKQVMAASSAVSGSVKLSLAAQAVNLRQRVKHNSLDNSTGNLFWWATVAANPANETERELHHLVGLLKEVLEGFDNDLLETMQGEEGFSTMSEFLSQLEVMLSMDSEKPEILAFTNWNGFFNSIDFGWGKPWWVGVMGKVGPAFRNLVIYVDSQWDKGIEAWITLEEKQMVVLENDKEFLAFASPNPGISSL